MPKLRWSVMVDHAGMPFAIARDGIAFLHVNPSKRTCENIESVISMLNDLDALYKWQLGQDAD